MEDVTDYFQLTEEQLLKCGAQQLMETSSKEGDELAQTDKTDDVQMESTPEDEEQKKPRWGSSVKLEAIVYDKKIFVNILIQ